MTLNFAHESINIIDFSHYEKLLPLIMNSLLAALILGITGGLIGIFVCMRDLSFAVHAISEISFAGAAFFLLIGASVITGSIIGSLIAALVLAWFSRSGNSRSGNQNSIIGVIVPFGLGLGILFISLYQGRSANKFSLLTGQIVSVSDIQLGTLGLLSALVCFILIIIWKPLTFSSIDANVAASRGIRVDVISYIFMALLGISVALSIQVVGTLLVLSLLITPSAAALRLTANPSKVVVLSLIFAVTSSVGGVLLAAGSSIPVSPFVTTISFVIYCVAALISKVRSRQVHIGSFKVENS